MSRVSVRLCVLLVAVLAVCATDPAANDFPIKNVIVLMMENRSFDHMLGFLKQTNPNINGLNGDEYNPYNTTDPDSARVTVTSNALYVDPDPDHSLTGTAEQVFGGEGHWVDPAPMNGFVQNAVHTIGQDPESVMQCFNYSTVPIITTLAQEFALCDSCYASVPGPTEVNRMFVHSATSNGTASNPKILGLIEGFPQKSIYKMLQENGISWGVYYQLISTTLLMRDVRSLDMLLHQHPLEQFFTDAAAGKLPQYSFVDPRYYPFLGQPANDQHPSHSVLEGERLMKQVYEAVRASPQWNETLLVITYDEHGGFYDHQPTPLHGVPNPDGLNSHKPAFNFTRLGVRIPTLFISPWVNKGAVIHDPVGPTPTSKREHSSVPATLKKIFNLPNFLTKRDEWAGTFDDVVMDRDSPRTDCPTTLPDLPDTERLQFEVESARELSDLQRSFMDLAAALVKDDSPRRKTLRTKAEGAEYVQNMMARFFAENSS